MFNLAKVYKNKEANNKINVSQIISDAENPSNNSDRKLVWELRYFMKTGIVPSLKRIEKTECRYCHKTLYVPHGAAENPFSVFCSNQCEDDYSELDLS